MILNPAVGITAEKADDAEDTEKAGGKGVRRLRLNEWIKVETSLKLLHPRLPNPPRQSRRQNQKKPAPIHLRKKNGLAPTQRQPAPTKETEI